MKFTALLHHLTVGLLRDSFYALKWKAAPGVDGVTWIGHKDIIRAIEARQPREGAKSHGGAHRPVAR